MRGLHIPNTSNASFWIGSMCWRAKESALSRRRRSVSKRIKVLLGPYIVARLSPNVPEGASAKCIFGAGNENTGAACLTPDALVARSRRTVVVVARDELALVDPQLTVEEMQLFHARMRMRGVTCVWREAYQHADTVLFRVGREQLAFDPGRDLFPFRLGPLPCRRQHRLPPGLLRDAKRKAPLQRRCWTQQVGGPADKLIDHRPEALQLVLAIRARGDVCLDRGHFARTQDLQDVGARQLGAFTTIVWGMRGFHIPNTSNASFWIGPMCERKLLSAVGGALGFKVPKYFLSPTRQRWRTDCRQMDRSCARRRLS